MASSGQVDLGVNLRDVQLLLHLHHELVAKGLVQLHLPPGPDGVGPVHPEQAGALLAGGGGGAAPQAGQHRLRHGNVRLGRVS